MTPQHQQDSPHDADERQDYLLKLQQLATSCRTLDFEEETKPSPLPNQLLALADALDRLEEEVNEIRDAQRAAGGALSALERRMAAIEQSTPSPQSWRDLIQGIRSIRELVATQAQPGRRP